MAHCRVHVQLRSGRVVRARGRAHRMAMAIDETTKRVGEKALRAVAQQGGFGEHAYQPTSMEAIVAG